MYHSVKKSSSKVMSHDKAYWTNFHGHKILLHNGFAGSAVSSVMQCLVHFSMSNFLVNVDRSQQKFILHRILLGQQSIICGNEIISRSCSCRYWNRMTMEDGKVMW